MIYLNTQNYSNHVYDILGIPLGELLVIILLLLIIILLFSIYRNVKKKM